MDSSRLRTGEIVAGIGGVALFLFLFFDWFGGGAVLIGNTLGGTSTIEHPGISGWDSLTDLPGFLIIVSGVAGIALAYLAAAGQRLNIPVRRGAVTALLGALAVLLILWRMFAGSPTLKIGVFLGLGAAIAITVGALMALREDGFEPLIAVAGGRTKAMSPAAAPAAPATPPPAQAPNEAPTEVSDAVSAPPASSSSSGTAKKRSTAKKTPAKSGGSRSGSRSGASKSRSSSPRSGGTRKPSSGGRK